jgi:hypothetical protein
MGEELDSSLPCGRSSCRLWLRRSGLRIGQESAPDVVGDIAVECLVGSIEPKLPGGRRKDEIHFQPLLHPRAPVLEINRAPVLEGLLPLLRRRRIAGNVAAAVEIGQLAVADDLQRLERHHAVAPAKCLRAARHQLQF